MCAHPSVISPKPLWLSALSWCCGDTFVGLSWCMCHLHSIIVTHSYVHLDIIFLTVKQLLKLSALLSWYSHDSQSSVMMLLFFIIFFPWLHQDRPRTVMTVSQHTYDYHDSTMIGWIVVEFKFVIAPLWLMTVKTRHDWPQNLLWCYSDKKLECVMVALNMICCKHKSKPILSAHTNKVTSCSNCSLTH